MTLHFQDDVAANLLTIDATDPKSGTAEFKATAIRIEKLAAPARSEAPARPYEPVDPDESLVLFVGLGFSSVGRGEVARARSRRGTVAQRPDLASGSRRCSTGAAAGDDHGRDRRRLDRRRRLLRLRADRPEDQLEPGDEGRREDRDLEADRQPQDDEGDGRQPGAFGGRAVVRPTSVIPARPVPACRRPRNPPVRPRRRRPGARRPSRPPPQVRSDGDDGQGDEDQRREPRKSATPRRSPCGRPGRDPASAIPETTPPRSR